MPRTILDRARVIRQRLMRLEGRPLGKAALLVVIFLDLFILSSLFRGLDAQTRQLAAPDEIIPPACRNIVIDQTWNTSNRLDRLAQLVRTHPSPQLQGEISLVDHARPHPICRPLIEGLQAIHADTAQADQLHTLVRLEHETAGLRARVERLKGAYDTHLLEKIAGEPDAGVTPQALRGEMAELTGRLEGITAQSASLRQRLQAETSIQRFFQQLDRIGPAQRTALIKDQQRLYFWHPVRRLGMELLFLLPLLTVFYFWNSRSLTRDRPYQTLVSAHLLAVTMIPVLFETLRLAYDIIPHRLIRHLIELLEGLKLVALWHYLVIAASVATALALIYLFQKKLFSQERLTQRRLAKGECHACGLHLPGGGQHCPACGAAQYRTCGHCQQATLRHGRYCMACGWEAPDG
ncbi:MAG TPA: zinc ribbon domain-containing protein [Thiobacillaceae bacterium]|nr:zinc ribbon domain-containing protein [Thiobacillaceae bacterium]HNU64883.1 zinc ribbon domain-containing protein [Thiobacillaceae bacterium]